MAELPLARDFPPAEEADWQALVEKALKGSPFASLRSESYDGIVIEPLYGRAAEASVIPGRQPGEAWTVVQRLDDPDPAAANRQALDDLNNGASGLTLVFSGAIGDYGFALEASPLALAESLEGVQLDAGIGIELDLGPTGKDAALMLTSLAQSRGLAPDTLNIRFGFDPLGALASHGRMTVPWPQMAPLFAALVADLKEQGFAGPFAVGDGRPVHAAGGSEAQELAYVLAIAVSYLRSMEAANLPLEDAFGAIYFRLAADQNQVLTIAKFRSLRKLWARIEESCGLEPRPVFIAAETAWRMMTKRDPHGNIVRGTIATLAAALGGANAITVLPFTAAIGVPDDFARRIARNTQTILIEEANLHRVADPAAGAGAIEVLTQALCEAAWGKFQEIENAGGAAAALERGLIQRAVAEVRAKREANIARRKEPLVGTSDFSDLDEQAVAVAGSSQPRNEFADKQAEPLPRIRLAEPFEYLRDGSDAELAQHGARPAVFLATIGDASDFTARASFAKTLFEAGGIEAVTGNGVASTQDIVEAFQASGAKLACLCSSDKIYASEGANAAKALAAAGAKHIYLAGTPGDHRRALEQAGVGTFLYQGCDTLEILKAAYDIGT
jgi:methylmalonyl-CoA mutase